MRRDPIPVEIRLARMDEVGPIVDLLHEAANWLSEQGIPMWHPGEIAFDAISNDVRAGLFFVAEDERQIIAAIKFQLDDPLFWPDVPNDDSAFVHRFVISRAYAGRGVSSALLQWAVDRANAQGKRYLRLDCEAARPKLRALYESFGFRHHSDRQVGPFFVSRYEYAIENDAN